MCQRAVGHDGIIEVGCFHGRSSTLLGYFVKSLSRVVPLTLIDPFLPWRGWDLDCARRDLRQRMGQIGVPYRLIEQPIADVPPSQLPLRADLAHIDGDHAKASVEADCRAVIPLLRPGGIVCFHDYRPDFAVREVADQMCAGWRVPGTFGSMRAFRKPYGDSD
jgi:hypothetical protein